jgi:flagellar biosynthetic protein FliR
MFSIPVHVLLSISLVFVRISAILAILPFFGDSPVPVRVRILFSVALTSIIWPLVPASWSQNLPTSILPYTLVVLKEAALGMIIGFLAKILFDGIVAAASLLGYQMGFGTASLFIPDAGQQMDSFTAFHRIVVILLFLALDFHHVYLSAITETFRVLGPGEFWFNPQNIELMITHSALVFSSAIQLAAPVLIALLFSTAALGLMARAVPQLNVFIISFPVGFFVGLLVYIASLPFFPNTMERYTVILRDVLIETIGLRG